MPAIVGKRSFLEVKNDLFQVGVGDREGHFESFLVPWSKKRQNARDPHRVSKMTDFRGPRSVIL